MSQSKWATKPSHLPAWHLDWLAFTVKVPDDEASQMQWAGGVGVSGAGVDCRGVNGYKRGLVTPYGAQVFFDGATYGMGIHVVLPGRALASEPFGGFPSWAAWVDWVAQNHEVKASRVDIAYDTERVAPQHLVLAFHQKQVTTRIPNANPQWIGRTGAGRGTVGVGKRGASAYVRLYDKADEQGKPDDAPWFRLEYEFRAEAAERVMENWRAGEHRELHAKCARALSVRTGTDKNPSRRPLHPDWAQLFGGDVRYARPEPCPEPQGNLDARAQWAAETWPRTLAMLRGALDRPRFIAWIEKLADAGENKLTEAEAAEMAAWAEQFDRLTLVPGE